MRVLVAYHSKTGNTERIARAMYDEILTDKEIKPWDEVGAMEGYGLYFVGFPVHQFGPDKAEREFLSTRTKGKDIVMFVTHAMPPQAPMNESQMEKCRAAADGANLVGFFNCQGELSQEVADMLKGMSDPQMQKFGELRHVTVGHPTGEEVEAARSFARDVMAKFG